MSINQMIVPNSLSQTISCRGVNLQNNTVGYSPSSLNYYEENQSNPISSGARSLTMNLNLCRVGKMVTFNLDGITNAIAGGSSVISLPASTVPARFRPSEACSFLVRVLDNAVYTTGLLTLALDGSVVISVSPSGSPFTNGTNCGFDKLSVSYSL